MILFPMVGRSSRFFEQNYSLPKYMLPAGKSNLFLYVLKSFQRYFNRIPFIFVIYERGFKTRLFIVQQLKLIGLDNYKIIELSNETKGQSETVYLALKQTNINLDHDLTIFNVDTIRPNFRFCKSYISRKISYLETFIGEGKNWSNVVPDSCSSNKAIRVTEKEESSKYCCTGLYYFSKTKFFLNAYEHNQTHINGELFVAPLYNHLINAGEEVYFTVVDKDNVIICGTPSEYEKSAKRLDVYFDIGN
jgi:NDP-sugar pyrophosphorylase family protein